MFKLGDLRVEVKRGDLTKQAADAICNPANSLMFMGGGAAGALKRAGGEEIEREALRHVPVPVGKAIATTAGKLRARWVIHAPTMERPAMPTTSEKVYLATRAALLCAERVGAKSMVLPGMGTGVGGVSFAAAAKAMAKALKEFAPAAKSLRKIVLCDLSVEMVDAWERALGDRVGYAEFKAPKGVIKVELELAGDKISRISLSGDFFMYPEEAIGELERMLKGVEAEREPLLVAVRNFYRSTGAQTPMVEPEHWVEAIMRAVSG